MPQTSSIPLAPTAGRRSALALAAPLLDARQEGRLPAAGLLVLRVGVGVLVAWLHGLHKVQQGIAYFASGAEWPLLGDVRVLGLPAPVLFASLAALSQFAGGILLALGLLTRPAALGVAVSMAVAVWLNAATGGPDAQLAGLYGIAALALALTGGGRYSLDRVWGPAPARWA